MVKGKICELLPDKINLGFAEWNNIRERAGCDTPLNRDFLMWKLMSMSKEDR